MTLLDRARKILESAKASPADPPVRVRIPNDRVDAPAKLGPPFSQNAHYFQVRVNEMFLTHKRKWLTEQYPMVFALSEFLYGAEKADEVEIPFVVGPSLLGAKEQDAIGMTFSNTRVAGIHPYRGGRVSISLILYGVPAGNVAQNVLTMVENVAGALDFSNTIAAYTKVAGALVDGVEMLTGMDRTAPVVSHRIEIDPDAGDDLEPGYYALVDMPESELDGDTLYVIDSKLRTGPNRNDATPFRDADYVLYSLATTPRRSDIVSLPFYPQWARIVREASIPRDDAFAIAKANMASFSQSLLLSADLVVDHARALTKDFRQQMKDIHELAVDGALMGDGDGDATQRAAREQVYEQVVATRAIEAPVSEDALASVRDEALAALDL